jgi:hypothetical protein
MEPLVSEELRPLLNAIQESNSRQLLADRDALRIGPFVVAFHPHSDLVWNNYATPVETAGPENAVFVVMTEIRSIRGWPERWSLRGTSSNCGPR